MTFVMSSGSWSPNTTKYSIWEHLVCVSLRLHFPSEEEESENDIHYFYSATCLGIIYDHTPLLWHSDNVTVHKFFWRKILITVTVVAAPINDGCYHSTGGIPRELAVAVTDYSCSFLFLECRKWGFKRWGFKEIRGYLRKKAFFLLFLDFPGALRTVRKRAKKAEKGRKRPISADFREGRPDTP